MCKRIAKKILRNIFVLKKNFKSMHYTPDQIYRARMIILREQYKMRGYHQTKGYRFGKWDDRRSMNPNDIPF